MKPIIVALSLLLSSASTFAAQLAIVIDDFGYRQRNEQQMIQISPKITVAVLPHAQHAKSIAEFAHQHGNQVIIHLPMAPISKQPLEQDTLFPSMPASQIEAIVADALTRVPYAVGVNNHMGSLMTSDETAMDIVMHKLAASKLFFLDSRTIAKSKVVTSAKKYQVPVLSRNIFLDDERNEAAISKQLDAAIKYARKHGRAIAIGHPHPETVNAVRQKLAHLPADIQLVQLSDLLSPMPPQPAIKPPTKAEDEAPAQQAQPNKSLPELIFEVTRLTIAQWLNAHPFALAPIEPAADNATQAN